MNWLDGAERRAWLDRQENALAALGARYLGPDVMGAVGRLGRLAEFSDAADYRDYGRFGGEAVNALAAGDYADAGRAGLAAGVAGAAAALPFVAAGPLDNMLRGPEGGRGGGIRAYHGSPHDFDRFSMDAIGTGEGAQAYGHGLYFAESEGVARAYRDKLGGGPDPVHRPQLEAHRNVIAKRLDRARAAGDVEAVQALEAELSAADEALTSLGRMYEVEIAAAPDAFLDWDAPLSEQPEAVRRAMEGFPDEMQGGEAARAYEGFIGMRARADNDIVQNAPRAWARLASQELRDAGIPGIKYFDAGSRGAGEGTRNYVVFDDRLITILRKYGLGAAVAGGAYALTADEYAMAEEIMGGGYDMQDAGGSYRVPSPPEAR